MRARYLVVFLAAMLVATGCTQGAGGPASTSAGPGGTSGASAAASANPNDLLAKVKSAGVMRVSTDSNYAPQSFQKPDGTFEGFDIDVGNEIAKRLGIKAEFQHVLFDLVVAGSWNSRWDLSVGSVTVTEERKTVLDFTQPYYYTPAQLTASTASGITAMEGFAGKSICVGSSTTYQFWIEGTLKLVDAPPPAAPPAGAKAAPLETDQLCAQAIKSGRDEFQGWLSSSTTVDSAIKDGTPVVKVGDPVFFEALSIATDKNGPPHAEFNAAVDKIIGEMHADGTLTTLSKKWFEGVDLTKTTT